MKAQTPEQHWALAVQRTSNGPQGQEAAGSQLTHCDGLGPRGAVKHAPEVQSELVPHTVFGWPASQWPVLSHSPLQQGCPKVTPVGAVGSHFPPVSVQQNVQSTLLTISIPTRQRVLLKAPHEQVLPSLVHAPRA
jgi:hypothetical protein